MVLAYVYDGHLSTDGEMLEHAKCKGANDAVKIGMNYLIWRWLRRMFYWENVFSLSPQRTFLITFNWKMHDLAHFSRNAPSQSCTCMPKTCNVLKFELSSLLKDIKEMLHSYQRHSLVQVVELEFSKILQEINAGAVNEAEVVFLVWRKPLEAVN